MSLQKRNRIASTGSLQENMTREKHKMGVLDKYEVVKQIGQGSMGFVCVVAVKEENIGGSAINARKKKGIVQFFKQRYMNISLDSSLEERRSTGQVLYALKSIRLDRVSTDLLDELKNEISILKTLDHPNIVRAYEVYYEKKQAYIVLEACLGGDLYSRAPYSESSAFAISKDLLAAVKYMHDHKIVHRDLKFENIMFASESEDACIRVIDFGLAKNLQGYSETLMFAQVGTIYTMAPQVLQGVYTSQADLWSVGVIIFMMLSQQMPFYSRNKKKMVDQIFRARYSMQGEAWNNISDAAKHMVMSLLIVDTKKRLNASQAIDHQWLKNTIHDDLLHHRTPTLEDLKIIGNSMWQYSQVSTLKKIALNVIAHKSTNEEIVELRNAFRTYDKTNDGIIALGEFKEALKDFYPQDVLIEMFESIDVNKNGHIMYTEFLAATVEARGHIEEERIAEAFDRIDANDSGYISKDELKTIMGCTYSKELVDKIMEEVDENNDGKSKWLSEEDWSDVLSLLFKRLWF